MRRLTRCLGIVVLICCVQFVTGEDKPPAIAPSEKAKPQDQKEPQHSDALIAEEVRQRLLTPVTFECDHESLAEVLTHRIAEATSLNFYVDAENIEKSGVAYDELVVSGDFKNTSVRAVLKRILTSAKLAYFCDDTGVCITTPEIHDQRLFARVYDVSELIPESNVVQTPQYSGPTPPDDHPGTPPPPLENSSTHLRRKNGTDATPVKPVQFGQGMGFGPPEFGNPNGHSNWNHALTATSLTVAIKQATGGNVLDSWAVQGNRGTISVLNTGHAKLMVVRQSEAIHAEVEDLLSEVFTHHHMLEKEAPASTATPRNAGLNIVRPHVRIVKHR